MVKLYAVRVQEGWFIGITLSEEVDVQFWMSSTKDRPVRALKMVLCDCELPLQVALRASELYVEGPAMDQWSSREWSNYMVDQIRKGYEQCNGELAHKSWDMKLHSLKIWETGKRTEVHTWNVSSAQGDIQEAAECYRTMTTFIHEAGGLAGHLSELLEGRALLESEIESMLLAEGITVTRKDLYTALQWGVLQGNLELTNGVHTGEATTATISLMQRIRRVTSASMTLRLGDKSKKKDRMLIKNQPYCRRCGSNGEELQLTSCASCRSSRCWTCTACLNLGRSRSCGLIVMGVKKPEPQLAQMMMERRYGSLAGVTSQLEEFLTRYRLSPAQRDASLQALQYMKRHSNLRTGKGAFLLWAVTGAGKTEMMFPIDIKTLDIKGFINF